MAEFFVLAPAIVRDNYDPDDIGRVKVRFVDKNPDDPGAEVWARVVTLMAGPNRGSWFMPEIDDEVLVAFDGSEKGESYVIGAMWSDRNQPPTGASTNNYTKLLRTRTGVQIKMEDSDGQERLTLETPGGQKLTLRDGPGRIEIADSNGNEIEFDPSGITVRASARVNVEASVVKVNAATIDVSAGLSKFSGVVKCEALITKSVVSNSYTPGAGNIW